MIDKVPMNQRSSCGPSPFTLTKVRTRHRFFHFMEMIINNS